VLHCSDGGRATEGATCEVSASMRTFSYSPSGGSNAPGIRVLPRVPKLAPDSHHVERPAKKSATRSHLLSSDFRLLGYLESIINFDAEVPDRRFQLGMSEEQLYGAKVLGAPIDQGRLRPAHRVRSIVGAVQSQVFNPMLEDPCVLPGSEMG